MTRRAGKETSECKSGIGGDERQLVMVRLAARWRRFNLVILVTHKKGNQRKASYIRERDFIEAPIRKQRHSVRP